MILDINYSIADCSIISSNIYVLMAGFLVILPLNITETQLFVTTKLAINNFWSNKSFLKNLGNYLGSIVL